MAKLSFEELIETLTPEQFKIFFRFMYDISSGSDYDTLRCRVDAMYIDALAKHNTEMIFTQIYIILCLVLNTILKIKIKIYFIRLVILLMISMN